MPLHDFRCPDCGSIKRDLYLPITERAGDAVVYCAACPAYHAQNDYHPSMGTLNVRMLWIPQIGRMDCGNGASFTAFTTEIRQPDGSYKPTLIDSVHKLRQVERSTEQAAKNGEGEALRFRDWSLDKSQRDQNSFGITPAEQAQRDLATMRQSAIESGARKRAARISRVVSGSQPSKDAQTLGPGVTEASASPIILGD